MKNNKIAEMKTFRNGNLYWSVGHPFVSIISPLFLTERTWRGVQKQNLLHVIIGVVTRPLLVICGNGCGNVHSEAQSRCYEWAALR